MTGMKRLRCACGWEVTAAEEEAVAAVIDHGAKLHNMHASREEVLARLESVEDTEPGERATRPA